MYANVNAPESAIFVFCVNNCGLSHCRQIQLPVFRHDVYVRRASVVPVYFQMLIAMHTCALPVLYYGVQSFECFRFQ